MSLTKSLAGTWTITAARTSSQTPYSGTVQIHPMGKIYSISWLTTLGDYSGLGFFEDGYLLAGTSNNENYGLTIYTINGDGTLDGRWTTPASKGTIYTEKAVGGTAAQVEGIYQIAGTMTKIAGTMTNGNYEGTLDIRQLNDTYQVFWSTGINYQGVGLVLCNKLVITWGELPIYCLGYKIQDDKAFGRWAYPDLPDLGEENLLKIC